MNLACPAAGNCTGPQGSCSKPWMKGPRQKQFMFVEQNRDKFQFLMLLMGVQNTHPLITRADESTYSASNLNVGKNSKKKKILTLFPLPNKHLNQSDNSTASLPFLMPQCLCSYWSWPLSQPSVLQINLHALSCQCRKWEEKTKLRRIRIVLLRCKNKQRLQTHMGSKLSDSDQFRKWCCKSYQHIPRQLNDLLNHSCGPCTFPEFFWLSPLAWQGYIKLAINLAGEMLRIINFFSP